MHLLTLIFLAAAVLLTFLCSLGVLVMRDPCQRMQFAGPVVSIVSLLIAICVWMNNPDWQARIKVVLIGGTLFVMNAVLGHATARAVRIRTNRQWPPREDEQIPVVGRPGESVRGEEMP